MMGDVLKQYGDVAIAPPFFGCVGAFCFVLLGAVFA